MFPVDQSESPADRVRIGKVPVVGPELADVSDSLGLAGESPVLCLE